MPIRDDHIPWGKREKQALANAAAKGWSGKVTADYLNTQFHDGKEVRTDITVGLARVRYGLKVAKIPRTADAVTATEDIAQTMDVTDKGDYINVTTMGREVTTIEELVARANIDLTKYEVDRPETSMYETTIRDVEGNVRKVQNFRIVARFRLKQGPSTQEQVTALIEGAFASRKAPAGKSAPKGKAPAVNSGLMQAVVIADPHLGKYAYGPDTGWQGYNLAIGSRLVRHAATELLEWGDTHRPAHRYVFLLGDLLHYDTPHGTTTGGTPQDRDTRLSKMLEEAASVLCGVIERSAVVPTTVVAVGGNHDRVLSVAIQQILAAYFRKETGIAVDVTGTTRKYVEWGACLLGLTHGDTARKRLPGLMQVERKEAWGRSRVREWHHGHFHREAANVTEAGVTIREHLALCPPDGWHASEGYVGAPRGMDSFLYAKEGFLRGTWRSPVLDG